MSTRLPLLSVSSTRTHTKGTYSTCTRNSSLLYSDLLLTSRGLELWCTRTTNLAPIYEIFTKVRLWRCIGIKNNILMDDGWLSSTKSVPFYLPKSSWCLCYAQVTITQNSLWPYTALFGGILLCIIDWWYYARSVSFLKKSLLYTAYLTLKLFINVTCY